MSASEAVIKHGIDAGLKFAMAHPVAATIIVTTAIIVGGGIYIYNKVSESNKRDEDRSVSTGNKEGKIRNGN